MAAPVIRGSTAPAATTSPTSPATTSAGDLVIVVTWTRGGAGVPTHTLQSGFTEIRNHSHDDGSTDGRLSAACIEAVTPGATSYQAYTSSGSDVWSGIIVLEGGTFNDDLLLVDDVTNSVTQTNNAVPNPGSVVTPVADCLVIVVAAWYLASAVDVTAGVPTGYAETWEVAGSQTSELCMGTKTVPTATTEDPAAFSDNVAPSGTCSLTFAIQPGVSAQPITDAGAIATGEAFGAGQVNLRLFDAGAVASLEAFEAPSLRLTVSDSGAIASGGAFGAPTVTVDRLVSDAGAIASAEAFGSPTVTQGGISGAGDIASAEAFGTPVLHQRLSGAVAIASGEAFGPATLGLRLSGAGAIATAEGFGSPTVTVAQLLSDAGAIPSSLAFGAATVIKRPAGPSISVAVVRAGTISVAAERSGTISVAVVRAGTISVSV